MVHHNPRPAGRYGGYQQEGERAGFHRPGMFDSYREYMPQLHIKFFGLDLHQPAETFCRSSPNP